MPRRQGRILGFGRLFGYRRERKPLNEILNDMRGKHWSGRGGDVWIFYGYEISCNSTDLSKSLHLEEAYNESDGDLYIRLEFADEFDNYPIKNFHQETVTFIAPKPDRDEYDWTETEVMDILIPIMGSV